MFLEVFTYLRYNEQGWRIENYFFISLKRFRLTAVAQQSLGNSQDSFSSVLWILLCYYGQSIRFEGFFYNARAFYTMPGRCRSYIEQ